MVFLAIRCIPSFCELSFDSSTFCKLPAAIAGLDLFRWSISVIAAREINLIFTGSPSSPSCAFLSYHRIMKAD